MTVKDAFTSGAGLGLLAEEAPSSRPLPRCPHPALPALNCLTHRGERV